MAKLANRSIYKRASQYGFIVKGNWNTTNERHDIDIYITTEVVKEEQFNKIQNKKAPGPDGLKENLYKILGSSEIYVSRLKLF